MRGPGDVSNWYRGWTRRAQGRVPEPVVPLVRERFIPLHSNDIVDQLSEKIESRGDDPAPFRTLCGLVYDRINHRTADRYSDLVYRYSGVDPDRDESLSPPNLLESETTHLVRRLLDEAETLLEHANYRRLTPQQILDAIQTASHWGLKLSVRLSMFRRLHVYARGDFISKRTRRIWYRWYRLEEVDVPVYQRLVVLFRPKDAATLSEVLNPAKLHLRMFKNVPKADVDMLLPGSGIRISWIDKGRIGIPTAWGFFMFVSKLVKNIWLLAILSALKIFTSVLFIGVVIIASVYYMIRSVASYRSAKRRYQLSVTQSLYYQTLDNNLGVLLRLIEEARQQESCEAILVYYCVLASENRSASRQLLDQYCESMLKELGGDKIDFDCEDAMRDVLGMGIVTMFGDELQALTATAASQLLGNPIVRQPNC